ncbi:SDR family oxidoreductase [Curtobacterium sp. SORGH_AS_0776]|uniref:SDR family oxidoreductase n=1 Tax=Curtobacterium sp. SORGH_AS_0776 TaxID=3041798 RepID=UPI00285BFD47|nr:SDR family oxidoreductase [Curtobacterium sp. SORGH_AS_0776]MDR6170487.1 NAD(P)-dependent dehydrogenase (short-subunit alcohol dehydrogenase family) [Curtobacterium sp. SORGH_AS_0776]
MSTGLAGRTVLVVGAGSGIGTAVASAAAVAGARVVAASRRQDTAEQVAEIIGHGTSAIRLDLGDEDSIRAAAATLGSVDHVVTVAADHANGPVTALEQSDVEDAFRAKVVGPLVLAKHLAPIMPPTGAFVLFSGYVSARPQPGLAVMATTNGAVDALVPALAVDLAPIRVVGISPGVVDSGSWDGMDDKAAFFAQVAGSNPARRVGTPEDVADAVVFALTNPFLTATTVHLDGGQRIA